MDLFNCFRQECIEVNTGSMERSDLLRKLAVVAKRCSILDDISEEDLFNAFVAREEIGSTGFEDGLAIPHCRIGGIDDFVVGCVVASEGVDFKSCDGKASNLFFFIVAPENEREKHIRILAAISRALSIDGVKKEIMTSGNPENLKELFLRHISDRLESQAEDQKCSFQVVVQLEDKFMDVLQVVSALTSSISIIQANDASEFLHKLPLFSTFWSSGDKGFHKIITGVIDKRLANEMIRGLHVITDGLETGSGVMVVINEATYFSGSLKQ